MINGKAKLAQLGQVAGNTDLDFCRRKMFLFNTLSRLSCSFRNISLRMLIIPFPNFRFQTFLGEKKLNKLFEKVTFSV